ncbi:MAG TPA: aldehyde dehydrogenase family protein [Acidimicrobiales bacterium]|nr:aldehyde dehydrogenase family protein [Acidimicrobiales bacterium]
MERHLLIGGQHVEAASGKRTPDADPFTGETVATVPAAGPEDARRAVDAASAAFEDWAAMPPSERRKLFLQAASVLESRAHEAADLMTSETGSVAGWGYFNVQFASEILREAAAQVTQPVGDVLPSSVPGNLSFAMRQPAGVVASFAPWNAPIILGVRAVAAPLAAGNTVVLKPSENSPLSAGLFLADVLSAAGFPPGACNVVTTAPEDAPAVAEALISDPRVRRVSFTGSTKVGRSIGVVAATHLKPAVLELGGKNSVIVLEDADLEYAVNAIAFAAYMNSGQICMCADRVIAAQPIAEELAARLAEKAVKLPAGDPRDAGTLIGPLISKASAERVADLVQAAVASGAQVMAGGGRPQGAVYPASVLRDVKPDMRLEKEEIFGPVCTVQTVKDIDEAVAAANATTYGLTAGVITEDVRRGFEVARRLRTGIVHVNDQSIDDEAQAPFGGVGDSGYGRFGGRAGMEAFSELRWVTLQRSHRPFPF